ncbi:MAG: glycosyltransferase family 2 protein [Deltaproteobacteria bacterium]|nr:glycosyltransferase family 2 protein [Deltaproteobacteria bacterium]
MTISVILPTFNRAPFLREALASAAAQTLKPLETIVADDGSTDATAEICRRDFPDVRYFYQPNQGVAAARNLGIQHAKGEWIALLDSDDLWEREKLAKQTAFIRKNRAARVVQTEELWLRKGRRVNPGKRHKKKSGWIFEDCIPLCIVSPSAVMIHREVFAAAGPFDENFLLCEDYEMWLRVSLRYPIHCLPEKLTIKRNGHEGQLSAQWGQDAWRVKALVKILKDPKLNEDQRRLVRLNIGRRSRILAKGYAKHGRPSEAKYFENLAGMTSESIIV